MLRATALPGGWRNGATDEPLPTLDPANTIMQKSGGTTPSERYLARMCEKTFLGLWSYPNVYRDQGNATQGGVGKEICDVMVVCGQDIILFSDKSCCFPNTGDLHRDWARWFKRAVKKSAEQLYGAERWVRQNPTRVFVDRECRQPFPLDLAPTDGRRFFRVVVARGAKPRCQREFGGSGSMIVRPALSGPDHTRLGAPEYAPFSIGQVDSNKGYIHVLDDVTLDILLQELDTITDFIRYLDKKEAFVQAGKLAIALGEENLLAVYLREINERGEHDFPLPGRYKQMLVEDGEWTRLRNDKSYILKKRVETDSYLWDKIIQEFSGHILNGTLAEGSAQTVTDNEIGIRVLAKEPRFSRRVLARAMTEQMRTSPLDMASFRTVVSETDPETAYVFLLAPYKDVEHGQYRAAQRELLSMYCFTLAWKRRQHKQIVGVATESGHTSDGRSFDLAVVRPGEWTAEMEAEAKSFQEKTKLLDDRNLRKTPFHAVEYPRTAGLAGVPRRQRGGASHTFPFPASTGKIGRNARCPCGSGLKFKYCCGGRLQ